MKLELVGLGTSILEEKMVVSSFARLAQTEEGGWEKGLPFKSRKPFRRLPL